MAGGRRLPRVLEDVEEEDEGGGGGGGEGGGGGAAAGRGAGAGRGGGRGDEEGGGRGGGGVDDSISSEGSVGGRRAGGQREEQVLNRLEALEEQLQRMSTSQERVESCVNMIYEDMNSFFPLQAQRRVSTRRLRSVICRSGDSCRSRGAPLSRSGSPTASLRDGRTVCHGHSSDSRRSNSWDFEKHDRQHAHAHPKSPRSTHRKSSTRSDDSKELGFWSRKDLRLLKKPSFMPGAATCLNFDMISASASTPVETSMAESKGRVLPLHPDSWNRALFDFISLILLLYDSVMIPYQFAWQLPFRGWFAVASWLTASFWTVDMLLGFLTGYYEKDRLVMKLSLVAKHYLKRDFIINFIVVAADVSSLLVESLSSGDVPQAPLRLLRFIKLERIVKLPQRVQRGGVAQALDALNTGMREKGVHQQFNITVRVFKLVVCVMWVNHLGCCLWHGYSQRAIGKWQVDNAVGPADEEDFAFSYLLGLYWSCYILVSGGSVMAPTTTGELMLAACCIVFGFIFTSVVISSLLSVVIEYQDANKDRNGKLTILRQFLYQNKVCAKVAAPIVRQARERLAFRKRFCESDVDVLNMLSSALRSELWYELYGPRIAEHDYFHACEAVDHGLIRGMCFSALQHTAYGSGDIIFEAGEEAKGAFFVCHGALEYRRVNFDQELEDEELLPEEEPSWEKATTVIEHVVKGMWISEVAIWAHWIHRGWLDAAGTCELLTLQPESILKVIASHPKLISIAQNYSTSLIKGLAQEPTESLSDLVMPLKHSKIVATMPVNVRRKLNQGAANRAMLKRKSGMLNLDELLHSNGDCDLILDAADQVHRVVNVVGLRVVKKDSDGQLFVLAQIGELWDAGRRSRCEPPSTKVKDGEYPREALERLVAERLEPMSWQLEFSGFIEDQFDRVEDDGAEYRYMRTLYQANLDDAMDAAHTKVLGWEPKGSGDEELSQKLPPSERGSEVMTLTPLPRTSTRSGMGTSIHTDFGASYEAFVLGRDLSHGHGSIPIFAWLDPEDFDFLTGPDGAPFVDKWVGELGTILKEAV